MWWRKWRTVRGEALVFSALLLIGALGATEPTLFDEFEKRVSDYAAQHRTLAAGLRP